MTAIPRAEHPRPTCRRDDWLCLNGRWEFAHDYADDGESRDLVAASLPECITVPFCREAPLSGIHRSDRCLAVWYARNITVPEVWAGRTVLLHLGAADYETTVWCDGRQVAFHEGGHVPISADLGCCAGRTLRLVIRCRDDWTTAKPRGKQRGQAQSAGCLYTQTTGIWQTVWLEPVAAQHLLRPRITPLFDQGAFLLEQGVRGWRRGLRVEAVVTDEDGTVLCQEATLGGDFTATLLLAIPRERRRAWSPEDPHLYDLTIRLRTADGETVDAVHTHAGLRSIAIEGDRILLNGRPLFQRLILDQGYWPEGLLTAPSDAELEADIRRAQELGFNGARLHQKVFEERYLYHADRLGYLVWGELPDWCKGIPAEPGNLGGVWNERFVLEWQEAIERDYSHPAIVGWCALNECARLNGVQAALFDRIMAVLYRCAKQLDRTRPVIDVSGWPHRLDHADVYDHHDYVQPPEELASRYRSLADHGTLDTQQAPFFALDGRNQGLWRRNNPGTDQVPYRGQPFILSEFGGIKWTGEEASAAAWGYGEAPTTLEAFHARFAGQIAVLLANPHLAGFCYTQLTDVEQEQNGLYHYDRRAKYDPEPIRRAVAAPAAIEDDR